MSTKIIGNQISDATRAIITALTVTEQVNLPNLNQTQINALGTVALGTIIYNKLVRYTANKFESCKNC